MIDKSEIMTFSKKFGLRANVVEKDYVLGWMLAGIHNHDKIKDDWIFKGGTCLKKCYINTHRFSEDLDFTLVKGATLEPEFLIRCLDRLLNGFMMPQVLKFLKILSGLMCMKITGVGFLPRGVSAIGDRFSPGEIFPG